MTSCVRVAGLAVGLVAVVGAVLVATSSHDRGPAPLTPIVTTLVERAVGKTPNYFLISLPLPVGYTQAYEGLGKHALRLSWRGVGGDPFVDLVVNPYADSIEDAFACDEGPGTLRIPFPDGYQVLCRSSAGWYRVERFVRFGTDVLHCVVQRDGDETVERIQAAWTICASMQVIRYTAGLEPRYPARIEYQLVGRRDPVTVELLLPERYEANEDGWSFRIFRRADSDPAVMIMQSPSPEIAGRSYFAGLFLVDDVCWGVPQLRRERLSDGFIASCMHDRSKYRVMHDLNEYWVGRSVWVGADLLLCTVWLKSATPLQQAQLWKICESMKVTARVDHTPLP